MFDFLRATPKKRSTKINKESGVVFHNLYGKKKLYFYFGTYFFLISLVLLVYLYQPLFFSWIRYKNIDNQPTAQLTTPTITIIVTPTPIEVIDEAIEEEIEEEIEVVEDKTFEIEIPKIGAKAEVVIDVSPVDKNEYLNVLKNNKVAHSNFSSLPGNGKGSMTYLFAHSTEQSIQAVRKNSVFYLLGELNENDEVLLNYQNQLIKYEVYMKKIISSKETDYLSYFDSDKEILILQTCWPIGTNWKRLLIFAQRK